jgi:Ca-activated chloride channel family protein
LPRKLQFPTFVFAFFTIIFYYFYSMKKIIFVLMLSFISQGTFSQTAHKLLREGNKAYKENNFAKAAEDYYKALAKDPSNIKGKFNLGNATYKNDGFDEAVQHFSSAAELAKDQQTKADAYYNLGNSLFKKAQAEEGKGLEKSVEAYKNSLRLDPNDMDTKKNLALTQRLIQMQEQEQKQQQQQEEEQEEQEEEEEEEEKQEEQDQQQQQETDEEKKTQEQPKDLNKKEALELLKIMDNEEKKVQEKMRKAKGEGKKPEKDW